MYLLVASVSCATTAEPIEMAFGVWTRVGPNNRALGGFRISSVEGAFFRGHLRPTAKYKECPAYSLSASSDAAFYCQCCYFMHVLLESDVCCRLQVAPSGESYEGNSYFMHVLAHWEAVLEYVRKTKGLEGLWGLRLTLMTTGAITWGPVYKIS